jgi:hypothetical protein
MIDLNLFRFGHFSTNYIYVTLKIHIIYNKSGYMQLFLCYFIFNEIEKMDRYILSLFFIYLIKHYLKIKIFYIVKNSSE